MARLTLPTPDGRLESYTLGPASRFPDRAAPNAARTVYAAAHVVADPWHSPRPWEEAAIDWDATLAFRRHLWGLGFKVAEAMDTAQRGMGLRWDQASTLIRRSLEEARTVAGADLACGVGTDHLAPGESHGLDAVRRAYEEQFAHVERHGGRAILMASRALRRAARSADDYLDVYGRLVSGARDKVVLHWLGAMFDPDLEGYWGSGDVGVAMRTCLDLIEAHRDKIDGIKISLLDQAEEEKMRALLPPGVKMYTGDDFNFSETMEGDGRHHSHGLLGIFDPIAPAAAAALERLDAGDVQGYRAILAPMIPLSRTLFEAPTRYYKAGVVFLAWLNGFQAHFSMLGGLQSARGLPHYAEVFRLADEAGLFVDPDRAAARMGALCETFGVG